MISSDAVTVEYHVVVDRILPGMTGIITVIIRTVFVGLFNEPLRFIVRDRHFLLDLPDANVFRRVYKEPEDILRIS